MAGHGAEVEVPHSENDPFVKKVALSVALFAVVLTLAAAGGKKAGNEMMMGQMQASNEWNRYQAKVQREVLYMQEREMLEQTFGPIKKEEAEELAKKYEAAQKDRAKLPAEASERQRQRLAFITVKLAEYEDDKGKLTKQAKEYEKSRDEAHKRDPFFEFAELLLQIGIVLLSVAMLSKARWAFAGGCILAVGGLALTLMGYFTPDVSIPFLTSGASHEPGR
ncbi:MAG: DUF4337 domain-containing protein [Fimbriiglobus sp.]|nr:DUF4337 domain-containing protein [Fimbriiglobus sp.]